MRRGGQLIALLHYAFSILGAEANVLRASGHRCAMRMYSTSLWPVDLFIIFSSASSRFARRRFWMHASYAELQLGDVENAVAAAYTYLVAHPNDAEALANVRFWFEQAEFESSMLVDLLRPPYEIDYMSGIEAYEAKNWRSCVSRLESGAQAWLAELTSLRRGCDDALDWSSLQNDNPEIEIVTSSRRGAAHEQPAAAAPFRRLHFGSSVSSRLCRAALDRQRAAHPKSAGLNLRACAHLLLQS